MLTIFLCRWLRVLKMWHRNRPQGIHQELHVFIMALPHTSYLLSRRLSAAYPSSLRHWCFGWLCTTFLTWNIRNRQKSLLRSCKSLYLGSRTTRRKPQRTLQFQVTFSSSLSTDLTVTILSSSSCWVGALFFLAFVQLYTSWLSSFDLSEVVMSISLVCFLPFESSLMKLSLFISLLWPFKQLELTK